MWQQSMHPTMNSLGQKSLEQVLLSIRCHKYPRDFFSPFFCIKNNKLSSTQRAAMQPPHLHIILLQNFVPSFVSFMLISCCGTPKVQIPNCKCAHDNFCPSPPLMGLFDWLITEKFVTLWTHSNYKLMYLAFLFGLAMQGDTGRLFGKGNGMKRDAFWQQF